MACGEGEVRESEGEGGSKGGDEGRMGLYGEGKMERGKAR